MIGQEVAEEKVPKPREDHAQVGRRGGWVEVGHKQHVAVRVDHSGQTPRPRLPLVDQVDWLGSDGDRPGRAAASPAAPRRRSWGWCWPVGWRSGLGVG